MIRAVAPRFSQHRTRGGGLNATDNSSWVGSTRYRKVGSAYRTAGRSSPRRFRSLATFLRGISLTLIGCVACFSLVSVCFTNHSDDLFLLDQPFGTSFENDYSRRPRVLQIDKSLKNVFPITSPTEPQHSKRKVVPLISSKSVKILDDSDEYPRAEDPETDHCKPMYSWQKSSFPSCNLVHEIDLTNSLAENASEVLAYGAYRDVWSITGMDKNRYVLKTMLYERDFTVRNFDRYRRDAVAMERLTSSELILDIYGFCGSSAATEFADGGDLETTLWGDIDIYEEPEIPESRLTDVEKLEIATEAARSLADFHFLGEDSNEDRPIMAHTDIKLSQFVKVGSKFKLNDFNRARFLMWNEEKKKICTYRVRLQRKAENTPYPSEISLCTLSFAGWKKWWKI